MEPKQDVFCFYLQQRAAACKAKSAALAKDDRGDEAVFQTIKANIYEVFRTVWGAALKHSGGCTEKARSFFAEKLEHIPRNWQDSLARATAQGDTERAHIEQIKLDTVDEIKQHFLTDWEV